MSAASTLQPKIIFWVLACSRQPSKARAIERLDRNPCRIKCAGVDPTPERPVIGVEAVLAMADATAATLTPVAGDPDLAALDELLHFFGAGEVESPVARPAGVLDAGVVFRRQRRSASEAPSQSRGPDRAAAGRHHWGVHDRLLRHWLPRRTPRSAMSVPVARRTSALFAGAFQASAFTSVLIAAIESRTACTQLRATRSPHAWPSRQRSVPSSPV